MNQSEILLYAVKLVAGGIAAFFAVMLWSKIRDVAWTALVAGAVTSYAGIVYEMLERFGLVLPHSVEIAGIPLISLLFAVVPPLFYGTAFVVMLVKNK